MPAGFGFSVGDLVACTRAVRSIFLAFRDGTGASSTYQRLVADLDSLVYGLQEIRYFEFDKSQKLQKLALENAAIQCQQTIEIFLQQHGKYRLSLGETPTASKLRTRVHKVEWALCMKTEVDALRSEILGHTTTINTLLIAMQSSMAALQTEELRRFGQGTLEQSAVMMRETQSQIGQTHNMLQAQAATISRISDILELSDTQPKDRDVRSVMLEAFDMNMKVCRMALDLQKSQAQTQQELQAPSLPPQIERQHPVELEDAHGRVTPFHVEFINSFEAFQAVLEARFRHVPGWNKVKNREYAMKESNSNRRLDLGDPWDSVFLPGRTVTMSMVFWMPPTAMTGCPGCHLSSDQSGVEGEVRCTRPSCQLRYERIIDLEQTSQEIPAGKSFDVCWSSHSEKDKIHEFRRVQVRHVLSL